MCAIPTIDESEANAETLRRCLAREGAVLITSEPGDAEGVAIRRLVAAAGTAEDHNADGQRVWHVRFDANAGEGAARSRTMKAFPYHTDASFEEPVPRGVALYAVRADCYGAGELLLQKTADVLRRVSAATRRVLRQPVFRFRVPAEFDKGVADRTLPILLGDNLIRYRREIIDERGLTPARAWALGELDWAIANGTPIRLFLPSGMILLFDNARFLHSRTAPRDPERHLLRMRFTFRVVDGVGPLATGRDDSSFQWTPQGRAGSRAFAPTVSARR
ncbi:MAG: TauD/TfdA family dioxygenase [Isosphaeraceae bacterium]|nr:TauD/TfdA family dioxygenase [Isosphaeraceae bacterium]